MPLSISDLPLVCRNEIYSHLGLVQANPIDITYRNHKPPRVPNELDAILDHEYFGKANSEHPLERRAPLGPSFPLALFLVSKGFSRDCSNFFYSENKFLMRVSQLSDLFWSPYFNPDTIPALKTLHFRFEPIDESEDHLQALAKGWLDMIKNSAEYFTHSELALTLTSQVNDIEMAKAILEGIQDLPQLKSFTTSFDVRFDPKLRSILQATVRQLTGLAPASPFPFERLPTELRVKILDDTDLVLRHDPRAIYGSIWVEWCCQGRGTKCCKRCTLDFQDCSPFFFSSCCCIWKPAAHSSTCICKEVPPAPAIFMTGPNMLIEAQEIFFSRNVLIMTTRSLETINWLECLSETQRGHIRRIELFFPPNDEMIDWYEDADIKTRWTRLIELFTHDLQFRKLELRVNMVLFADDVYELFQQDDTTFLVTMTTLLGEIFEPLLTLRGMRSLRIYLGHRLASLETEVERAVMGSLYDSAGKASVFDNSKW